MARRCTKFYLLLMVMVVVPFSCRQENGQEPDDKAGGGSQVSEPSHGSSETLVYSGLFPIDTCYVGVTGEVDYRRADVYVCDHLWAGLLVEHVGEYDYAPWRLPTRKEASVLKTLDVFDKDRYVCVDAESGEYYTFKYGGSVTKAGSKTKYNVQPIRVVYQSDSVIVYL